MEMRSCKILLLKMAKSALRDKPGHGNGLYLVTDPCKCLILSIQHSTENPLVYIYLP